MKGMKAKKVRNNYVVPMNARCRSVKMKHRTEPRGGSKNKQAQYKDGSY
jgi:hypothetical protein